MGKIRLERLVTKRRVKILLPLLIVAVLIAAVVITLKNMNGPAEGSVAQAPPSSVSAKSSLTSPGKYNGKYISFTYPANYKVTPSQTNGGYLDAINLINTNHSGKYIAVSLVREDLQNDSGYNHRKTYPAIYKQQPAAAGSLVFTSAQNGSEQTGFITHGGLVLSVSVTANGNVDLNTDYNTITGSLTWKQ